MKTILAILIFFFLTSPLGVSQITVTEVGSLPESVANNAVSEGFINEVPHLFSFGGIDETKTFEGIHLKSFKYNLETGESISIPDLPDTLGKIAAGASRIGDVIYIIGGYHVFENQTELSSTKVHRYHIPSNSFLEDGTDIPISIDDQVQCVWRDSLIYVITGWSDVSNIPDVQIYNPSTDSWTAGSPTPDNNQYKSFGASGVIVGDEIHYFGGATSGFGFVAQSQYRKGVINPEDPMKIEWLVDIPDNSIKGYRCAATVVGDNIFWIGGSSKTYNYDGIAYDGSGGVPASNRVLYTKIGDVYWNEEVFDELPMDLRGIAEVSAELRYVAGGMLGNQEVSSKVFKIELKDVVATKSEGQLEVSMYPNPVGDMVSIEVDSEGFFQVDVFNLSGQKLKSLELSSRTANVDIRDLHQGLYIMHITADQGSKLIKFVKQF